MSETIDVSKIDKNFAAIVSNRDGMDWFPVETPGFQLDGLYWWKPGDPFRRIPLDAPPVSEQVDTRLSWHTAGAMLRFKSNTKEIRIEVQLANIWRSVHSTELLKGGFDLYIGSGNGKVFSRATMYDPANMEYVTPIYQPGEDRGMQEFTIHFPCYGTPKFLRIGLTPGAVIEPPTPWKDPRPVVVYGTSIQQGGCASRPGMCHTNQMSRMLNRPFINLGFSGSGKGEPAMAEILASIEDPAMYVLDYDANAGVPGLRATLMNVIRIIREKHPVTPILLVSQLPFYWELGKFEYNQDRFELTEIHLNAIRQQREAGDMNIHFLDGTSLYGSDPTECTVDGVHATDLGFYMISRRMAPVIERILQNDKAI